MEVQEDCRRISLDHVEKQGERLRDRIEHDIEQIIRSAGGVAGTRNSGCQVRCSPLGRAFIAKDPFQGIQEVREWTLSYGILSQPFALSNCAPTIAVGDDVGDLPTNAVFVGARCVARRPA